MASTAVRWDELSEEERGAYVQTYYETLRRDGNEAWREWRAWGIALGAIVVAVVCAVGMVGFAWRGQRVQAMVQVIERDPVAGTVKIADPLDLLAYTPPDGQWMDMLEQWVLKRHTRDDAPSEVHARQDWAWLYMHTCGEGRKMLDLAEKKEQPFNRALKKTAKVEVEAVTKSVTPDQYQVQWALRSTEKYKPQPVDTRWTTTFNVGRVAPENLKAATTNRLGLCVTWYDDAELH